MICLVGTGLVPALGDHKGRPYDAGCEDVDKFTFRQA